MGFSQFADVGGGKLLMDLAAAAPGDDLDSGLRRNVPGEEFVRNHDDARRAERLDNLHRISRRAADIGGRLHLS